MSPGEKKATKRQSIHPSERQQEALTLARSDGPATAALADDDWSQKPAAAEGTTHALRHVRSCLSTVRRPSCRTGYGSFRGRPRWCWMIAERGSAYGRSPPPDCRTYRCHQNRRRTPPQRLSLFVAEGRTADGFRTGASVHLSRYLPPDALRDQAHDEGRRT